jgi:hypothetical protein
LLPKRATNCFFREARTAGKSTRALIAAASRDCTAAVNRQKEKYGDAP